MLLWPEQSFSLGAARYNRSPHTNVPRVPAPRLPNLAEIQVLAAPANYLQTSCAAQSLRLPLESAAGAQAAAKMQSPHTPRPALLRAGSSSKAREAR